MLRRPWLWPPWRGWGLRPREAESLAPGHTGGEGIASSPGLVSVSIPPSVSVPAKSLQSCPTAAPQLLCPWGFPSKNTGMGCQALLQGIFPTQGWNACLLCLPAWAGGVFTVRATWEAHTSGGGFREPTLQRQMPSAGLGGSARPRRASRVTVGGGRWHAGDKGRSGAQAGLLVTFSRLGRHSEEPGAAGVLAWVCTPASRLP